MRVQSRAILSRTMMSSCDVTRITEGYANLHWKKITLYAKFYCP